MKYVRTKYRIREIIEDFGGSCNVKSIFPKGRPSIDNFTVVSGVRFAPRADTIEELCDEFVLHYGDTKQTSIPIPWASYERRDDNWQKHKEKLINELKKTERKAVVYGAIWTDKGLIYVAKMNEKGELELL